MGEKVDSDIEIITSQDIKGPKKSCKIETRSILLETPINEKEYNKNFILEDYDFKK